MRTDEIDDDGPLFRGGSTEQRDQYLEERARQDADFWAQMRIAQARLDQRYQDAIDEEKDWMRHAVDGQTFTSADALFIHLFNGRQARVGRLLRPAEKDRILAFARLAWLERTVAA